MEREKGKKSRGLEHQQSEERFSVQLYTWFSYSPSGRERHDQFMAEYSSIFNTRKKSDTGQSSGRKHSCNGMYVCVCERERTTTLLILQMELKRKHDLTLQQL